MFRLRKNSRVDSLIGAALKTNLLHSSRPKFAFILSKTSFLANPKKAGGGTLPVTSAKVPKGAFSFAQVAIFFFKPVVWAAIAEIFYSIFSQTLGTQTKKVLDNKKCTAWQSGGI